MGAPKPHDPFATAAAQGKENRATALATQQLNMVDQFTPLGDLTYEQVGTWADGTPRMRAKQNLTAPAQQAFDNTLNYQSGMSKAALAQLGRAEGMLSQPIDISSTAIEDRNAQLYRDRMDPIWGQRREAIDAEMVNRGIRPGTEAYSRAMMDFQRGRNDAENQFLMTNRQNAIAEMLLPRNQTLGELAALSGQGAPPSLNQQFVSTPRTSVNPADIQGAVERNYQQRVAANNGMLGAAGSILGGLFRLGAGGF